MKLESVETFIIKGPPPQIGGVYFYFVKLTTDDGVVGWGESAILNTMTDMYKAFDPMVKGVFEAQVKGRNPFDSEAITLSLYNRLCATRPGYVEFGIVSAFDTALWDIKGKYLNVPIYNMLGGKVRDKVRAYTYVYAKENLESIKELDQRAGEEHPVIHGPNLGKTFELWLSPKELAEAAKRAVDEEKFTALKFDPIPMPNIMHIPPTPWELSPQEYRRADEAVRLVREAIGPNVEILIGTHGQTTPTAARKLAKILEQYDVSWFEEPIPCEEQELMRQVFDSTTVPIATGERLVGIHEFRRLFAHGGVSFAQPDLGACGGITSAMKIATLAEAHYVQMAPHVWGGPIIVAAALQVDMAIPNFYIQECLYKMGGICAAILDEPIRVENGYFIPSERPGLGYNPVETQLKKFLA